MSRILVVEDEGIVAKDLQDILRRAGHAVPPPVASGEAAILAVEKEGADLVLMDIHIQGDMDGVQAAEVLRERFGVPVVYLTAYADDETLARAKATAPAGYLVKPFAEQTLRTTVTVALHRERLEKDERMQGRLMKEVLGALPHGVLVLGQDHVVRYANLAAEALVGAQPVGQPMQRLFKDGDELRRILLTGGRPRAGRLKDASGRKMDVLARHLDVPFDCLLLLLDQGGRLREGDAETVHRSLQERAAALV